MAALEGLLPDLEVVRKDFPILSRVLTGGDGRGQPLVYLDSANTSQKPQVVIDTMVDHLERHNANIARAMHQLGAEATAAYEDARDKVAAFIGAPDRDEVVFTKNITEGLNLLSNTLAWPGPRQVGPGDEIVITEMEHHSNIVPWQLLCERTGATLRWFGLTEDGQLDLSDVDDLITERTRVVSLVWVSNMLGTINPVGEIARRAHEVGAVVILDAAQAAPQLPIDLAAMPEAERPDVLGFTGHKVVGPTGIGVLWGRRGLLDELPPFLGGGEMIETVTMQKSTYAPVPHKYEAGTPPIVEAVGLGAAVDYLSVLGMDSVHRHEQAITAYALEGLQSVPGLKVLGPTDGTHRGGAISFEIPGVHPHDVATVLDTRGIAVRAGHHCAKPAHARFGVQSSTRMSSYLYTTPAEIDALVEGLEYTRSYFKLS
jgi:cysteine desulfurase / selenocysteine lyase